MLDYNQMMADYALCYADKSRITFIEKYLYTFNAMKGKKTPFLVFPRQRVFLNTLAVSKNVVSIKPRQCGITTLTSAWATGQCVFADKDAPETILCIGNKLDLAQQLITKIQDFLLQVPRWYWGDEYYSPDPKSEKNTKSIFVRQSKSELELFNGCRVIARSSGEHASRGISAVSILILDEAAFIENGVSVYATASATLASNPNAKTVMVSTPNGKDQLYYNTYRLAMAKENNFVAVQFRWYQDPRYNRNLRWYRKDPTTGEMMWDYDKVINAEGDIEYNEERWEKLMHEGWTPTDEWYTDMCKQFNNDRVRIAQELDVSFVGSADNVVDPEYIDMQEKLNVREPLEDMKDPLVEETWFWKQPIDGHRYIVSCLPEGEQVVTQRGLVNVEDVSQDDLLVTKEGDYTPIFNKMVRDVENEKIIKLRLSNLYGYISFTWNHPIYASCNTKLKRRGVKEGNKRYWDWDFDFINAENINKNDWVQVPNLYAAKCLNDKEILSHWNYDITRKDFHIENPLLNEEFWWFCGMWLAEGWISEDKHGFMSVNTCHSIKETAFVDKINDLAVSLFNRKVSITINKKNNTIITKTSSKELACFMVDNFGKYAKFKQIPEWIKFLPDGLKIQLIRGYMEGDGYIEKNKLYCGFTSISLGLLEGIQDMLFSLGIISSLKLHTKEGYYNMAFRGGVVSYCQNKYELSVSKYDTQELLKLFGIESDVRLTNRRIIKDVLFSEDRSIIYFRVSEKVEERYTGKVYNFETVSDSHTFCCRGIATHNCDPSRGSSEDYSAVEIIDMDGVDDNGMPIVEQVAQFYGKKLGNDLGEILYNYAVLYNNGYVVIDCTNGLGDVPLFALIAKGYKNIYYDDASLKKYTVQQTSYQPSKDHTDVMPGFHMQGNRYPALANFANMVRNNEFKIRSTRTINELNTWIFKGEAKRMDHQDGCHDDSITCLAIGLFVMMFSYKKMEQAANKDKAILNAYMMGSSSPQIRKDGLKDGMTINPKTSMPFYNGNSVGNGGKGINGTYMWLFSGYK